MRPRLSTSPDPFEGIPHTSWCNCESCVISRQLSRPNQLNQLCAVCGLSPCQTQIQCAPDLIQSSSWQKVKAQVEQELLGGLPAPASILDEAALVISGPRRDSYGPVEKSLANTASLWTSILKAPVTASQVALCMAGLKLLREANHHDRDSLVDLAGYAALAQQVEEAKERKTGTPTSP